MNERVLRQVLFSREGFVTRVAPERHRALVRKFDVQIQASLSIERFATSLAVEAILAGVMKHVSFQLCSLDKRFAAVLTNVRPVPGVRTPMTIQGLASREPSLADN